MTTRLDDIGPPPGPKANEPDVEDAEAASRGEGNDVEVVDMVAHEPPTAAVELATTEDMAQVTPTDSTNTEKLEVAADTEAVSAGTEPVLGAEPSEITHPIQAEPRRSGRVRRPTERERERIQPPASHGEKRMLEDEGSGTVKKSKAKKQRLHFVCFILTAHA